MSTQLSKPLSLDIRLLIRKPPSEVFEALADPSIATTFWYTKSTGRMTEGAELVWEWEMYGHKTKALVKEVVDGKRISFQWHHEDPTLGTIVTFDFIPYKDNTTYVRMTETGFTGDADSQVQNAMLSSSGFTFLMCALKETLEHGTPSTITADVHRSDADVGLPLLEGHTSMQHS